MDDDQHAEIIARLARIEGTVEEVKALAEKTNGRVTKAEQHQAELLAWKAAHTAEHVDLAPIADMARTMNQVRRFVLYGLPFLTVVSAIGGVVTVLRAVI